MPTNWWSVTVVKERIATGVSMAILVALYACIFLLYHTERTIRAGKSFSSTNEQPDIDV